MPINANADGSLVDIQSVDPTIVVELRYAGNNNLLKHPLYPQGTRALARPEVVAALTKAQTTLRHYQYGLKIWDAYRPAAVQAKLWQASRNSDYVANPEVGVGSLHSWGIAVDATLVDSWNRPVSMPSDFDDFTPAAMWRYTGRSFEILGHVAFAAMGDASRRVLGNAHRMVAFYGLGLGKNSCRKKHGNPRMSRELSGPVNYDRRLSSRFAPAGIRSRVAQSAARLRAACQLDRSHRRSDFKKPPSTHCHVDPHIRYLDFRLAGL